MALATAATTPARDPYSKRNEDGETEDRRPAPTRRNATENDGRKNSAPRHQPKVTLMPACRELKVCSSCNA